MNALIIEDEVIAAETLSRLLSEIRPECAILDVLQTVEDCVEWFESNPSPDLVFMDIHLADGSSFTIFEKVEVACPIVFTTAYNEYALDAFEVNGIDYLLKPINKVRLQKALTKYENISHPHTNSVLINNLVEAFQIKQKQQRSHFLIPYKDKLLPLAINDIAYIYAEQKVAQVVTFDKQHYMLDYSLDEVMKNVDTERFFRVSRQYIVSHRAVKDISIWFSGKLAVNLSVPVSERILVSKGRVSEFKQWFTRNYR